jgi:hypothetical protein
MTVRELIIELKEYPQDANVVICDNWEKVNDSGMLTECHSVDYVTSQTWYDDTGFADNFVEVIIN